MRFAMLALAIRLASVSSSAADSEPKAVALGESFELKIGGCARIEAEALQIGFEAVSADSRCPKGERCIQEGDATVRVWLQEAEEPKQTLELHTAARYEGEATYLGYEVKLLGLDPYPISGKATAREDYVATLEVTRGSGSAAADH